MSGHQGRPRVALAGNPNTGKTSLFNRLTGASARVGNYAGVTVEREEGEWRLPGGPVQVVDIPGTYSLAARSSEEQVAVRAIFGLDGEPRPLVVVLVLDATQLVRNLYLAMQVVEAGIPAVFALNLMDVARAQQITPDLEVIRSRFGVPVVPVSARTGEGMRELAAAVDALLPDAAGSAIQAAQQAAAPSGWHYPAVVEAAIAELAPMVNAARPQEARALALWALLSVDAGDELMDVPPAVRARVLALRAAAQAAGTDMDDAIIRSRYAFLDAVPLVRTIPQAGKSLTDRIDAWVLHPLFGMVIFLGTMGVLFQSLFAWSDPAIGAIEAVFGWGGDLARGALPAGVLTDLLVEGLIGGVGSVVVFLPQILLLFFLLGILEDSGYMSRVAFLVDRLMKALGLHGRAFVPMLSGYACAVPAIMATRTLESRRDRLLTMMVVPLMSCSARLPVYTLVIAALFPSSMRGILMVGMYVFSTGMALLAAGVLGRTLLKGRRMPLLLELPPYRLPRLATVLQQMWLRARAFLTEAGTVITACTVVLWFLLSFPRDTVPGQDFDALRQQAWDQVDSVIPDERLAEIDALEQADRLQQSYAGRLGRAIEPVIAPLGFDWKIGVGLIGAFAAREVFVSTMGLVYGIGGDITEDSPSLREKLASERHPDGSPVYTPLTGVSLMVFFALSAQCMSTVAAVRRESRSWAWAGFLFVYMTVLAWSASLIVYQGGRVLGY